MADRKNTVSVLDRVRFDVSQEHRDNNTAFIEAIRGLEEKQSTVSNSVSSIIPAGTIIMSVMEEGTDDWLICDGSTIGQNGSGATHQGSRFEALFKLVSVNGRWGNTGIAWGEGTAKLPDFRDKFPRGADPSQPSTPQLGGFQAEGIAAHVHVQMINDGYSRYPVADVFNSGPPNQVAGISRNTVGYTITGSDLVRTSTQDGYSSSTRPKNAAVNYLIKV